MTVRAKFKVDQISRSNNSAYKGKDENGNHVYEPAEIQTITLSPVYGGGAPNHENTKFWQATPTGQIQLGTVNADAGRYFELGQEYYIDFTKAA